ncbi:glutamine synthetase family protein [Roseibium sp. SCP14]|uniref:glutamine synthetase family protein n=1 Tax=Roseibium sp. SCP14 TaxID=3141375 RepID=UPI003334EB4F
MNLRNWIQTRPEVDTLLLCAPDVNGVIRGKAIPAAQVAKLENGDTRMALSTATVDIWGNEIFGCSQVRETGDCDVVLRPTGRAPFQSILTPSCAIVPVDFWMEDGTPMETGCRHALAALLQRFNARGWRPVTALEFEFYLYDPKTSGLDHPVSPLTGERLYGREAGQISDLEHFSAWLTDVRSNCEAAGIAVTTLNSENGTGMFEVNLSHCDDVLHAVDDGVFLRRVIRDTAHKHGLGATFMAKPFPDLDGSGLHIHFSLMDEAGANLFDNGGGEGTSLLHSAAAGILQHANEMQLIMAPHLSSYRRVQPNSYAPVNICWGYDNRSVPVRIPGGDHRARRIEHRLAGADANPYLVTLAILAAALDGIEAGLTPPPPVQGACYDQGYPSVVSNMQDALRLFEESSWTRSFLPPLLREAYVNCKTQELAVFQSRVTEFEIQTYRDRI